MKGGYPPQQGGYPPQGQPGQPWYNQYNTGVDAQKMQTLRAWFDSVDKDRSGQINAPELAQVQFGGKPLGPEIAAKFIKVYDRDNTKSIDFNEYVALHQMLEKLSNAFFTADADRSGTLDAREIYTAIQQAGFQGLSPQTIDAFGRKIQALTKPFPQPGQPGGYPPQQPGYPGQPGYPPQQPGQPGQPGYPPQQPGQPGYPPQQGYPPVTIAITFQQFLDICAQLSLVKSIFDLADTDRDGRVTFTWDQLAFSTVDLNA
jgi:Ca2+-binding EF-hand superfamily protein